MITRRTALGLHHSLGSLQLNAPESFCASTTTTSFFTKLVSPFLTACSLPVCADRNAWTGLARGRIFDPA
jgi:hypothetical protein